MKNTNNNKKRILTHYMNYLLEHGKIPNSVYQFSKELKIEEQEFYKHFGSFTTVSKKVYSLFFEETIQLITQNKSYYQLDAKNQLLLFYYTFFEVLTANRSYVLISMELQKNIFEKAKMLQTFKIKFKEFIQNLDIPTLNLQKEELNKIKQLSVAELAFKQLLFTLQFWIEDTSPEFEKTDIFIEKSVNASFFLLDSAPLNSIMDLGKFYFKERIKPTY